MQPDVVGLELKTALEVLKINGCQANIFVTRPPRGGEPVGEARVVRQTGIGNEISLVIAYREYL